MGKGGDARTELGPTDNLFLITGHFVLLTIYICDTGYLYRLLLKSS